MEWRNAWNIVKYGIYGIFKNTEFTEYSVFDLNWTDKKAEAKNTRLFWNVKERKLCTAVSHTIDLMTVLKAILTGEGSCITGI